MSILRTPVVADAVARVMAKYIKATPKAEVWFPEITAKATATSVPTRHGEVAATIYHPPAGFGGTPAVYVNVHGGGFVIGHREQDDPWCRYLATHANVVVVNADYLLAPRWRFPTPVEQVYDVVKWAASPDREWDGARLCVGGQSAGGNLSAAAARMALENHGPDIKLQVLHYANLDHVTRMKDKQSRLKNKSVVPTWMCDAFDVAYVPTPMQRRDRLVSPAWGTNADRIEGIAPALVITAEFDPLRQEGAAYAEKLDAAGSLVEYFNVLGVDHGYNIASSAAAVTRQMYTFISEHVVRATTDGG